MQAATDGDAGHLAVRAVLQTAARGRGGRVWDAPVGNLNLSLLLRPHAAPPEPGRFALLAGVALYDAINQVAPGITSLSLKWPNDVLRDGAKMGGILIDSALSPAGSLAYVVIGIGVNVATSPTIPGRQTACLADFAADSGQLASQILRAIDRLLATDFATVRADWLARAHPIGTKLTVRTGDTTTTGRFGGLAPDGALLLLRDDPATTPRPINSGEIFLNGDA